MRKTIAHQIVNRLMNAYNNITLHMNRLGIKKEDDEYIPIEFNGY